MQLRFDRREQSRGTANIATDAHAAIGPGCSGHSAVDHVGRRQPATVYDTRSGAIVGEVKDDLSTSHDRAGCTWH
jgi:hypothetical protein